MERHLQAHINQICSGKQTTTVEGQEREEVTDYCVYESYIVPGRHLQMPFMQMLLEDQAQLQPPPLEHSSFQLLLKLQEERLHRPIQLTCDGEPWPPESNGWIRPPPSLELESCVTYASESLSDAMNQQRQQEQNPQKRKQLSARCRKRESRGDASAAATGTAAVAAAPEPAPQGERGRRKRPRRPARNVEEVERQRMTHIAVERNRRKIMNDHLSCLRALMPPASVQRGDQASIISGVIDFVKEMEQLLQSLQAEKKLRAPPSATDGAGPFHDFFTSPQYTAYTSAGPSSTPSSASSASPCSSAAPYHVKDAEDHSAAVSDVEATVVQTHVNLRVLTSRRPGQLLRAVAALEELHLSVLHLNITTLHDSVFYSLNLKMEEECKLSSADEIAGAAHQIFSFISSAAC